MLHPTIKQEIRDAVYTARDFGANWTDDDYVGGICKREEIDIQSQEIQQLVFDYMGEYSIINDKRWE